MVNTAAPEARAVVQSLRDMIPAHHTGFRRYTKPSPSKPCRSLLCINPYASSSVGILRGSAGRRRLRIDIGLRTFFVITKLVPVGHGAGQLVAGGGR